MLLGLARLVVHHTFDLPLALAVEVASHLVVLGGQTSEEPHPFVEVHLEVLLGHHQETFGQIGC